MTNVLHPFESGTFALRMGVRPLSLDTWLEVNDATIDAELALKRELIAYRYDEIVATAGGTGVVAACQELDDLVVDWWSGRDARPPEPDGSLHPIVRVALRTQEDWCLLAGPAGDVPLLVAGCVCFPTRWILAEKLGRSATAIHGPVAFYDDQLAAPVDRFLARLRVGAPVWRANWNLVDDDALCQAYLPEPGRRLTCTGDDVADLVQLRVERQTLRRLPNSGAIAFGIRVHQESLRALEADPGALTRLLSAIRALPAETFAYKGLAAFWPELEAWLMSRTSR
jgi:hypothetical protein